MAFPKTIKFNEIDFFENALFRTISLNDILYLLKDEEVKSEIRCSKIKMDQKTKKL